MTTADLIVRLRTLGVELYRKGGKLAFDAPKGVLTDDLGQQLRQNKEAILAYLAPATAGTEKASAPKPYPRNGNIPVCGNQKRLWFLDQLTPGDVSYNIPLCVRLTGPLKIDELERALNTIVRRHEVLRLSVSEQQGVPVLHIADSISVKLHEIAVASSGQETALDNAMAMVNELASIPFDLHAPPLFRTAIYRLAEDEYVFVFVTHHFLADGWSMGVFYRELSELYHSFVDDAPASLPQLPLQYIDVALWQDEQIKSNLLQDQLKYWKKQLAGVPQVLDFPYHGLRQSTANGAGQRIEFEIEPAMAKELRELSRRHAKTLFSLLLSAFQVLLFRYSGQEVLTVGTAASNRNCEESENLIGFFANNLPLVARFEQDLSFLEFLELNSNTIYNALANQDIPFDKLVDAMDPDRDLNKSPIFQFLFLLHNHSVESSLKLPQVRSEKISLDLGSSTHDMSLVMEDSGTRIAGTVEFRTDVLSTELVDRFSGHYLNLLTDITKQPEQKISRLEYLGSQEKQQLLVEWNSTTADYPQNECIHQLFEAEAAHNPGAIAIEYGDVRLTYGELNTRASQLAYRLRQSGVGPEVLVGICVERSLEMVIGLLGVLKAGGAYVPLDPDYPRKRLAFMLEDAKAPVLLTQSFLAASLPEYSGEKIFLDEDFREIGDPGEAGAMPSPDPSSLAYLIYTSGSTGKPKGVQIGHRGVVNFLASMSALLGFRSGDKLISVTSLSFDIAVLELFLPLTSGGSVTIVSSSEAKDGLALSAHIADSGARFMQATPSTWRLLVEADWGGVSFLNVLCGGESLSPGLADKLRESNASLWNLYGPTEATVWSTAYKVEGERQPVLIGRPIHNTQIYILDEYKNPVPVGVPGELYIGGDGLARGYLNRPELTEKMFVRNPFSQRTEARIYRTGDLARYLPGGNIEFLGRVDHQVKIRGFRIELGEIEAVLAQHPAVREASVLCRDDDAQGQRLIGYVVAEGAGVPTAAELRAFVSERLPNYMVPSAFMVLDSFPLTPNGKLDRRALPAPDGERQTAEVFVEPRSDLERQLADIWRDVLAVDRVGIHDNFFHLGGHSLMTTQVVSRIRDALGVELPVTILFEHQTLEDIADRIEMIHWTGQKLQDEEMVGREEFRL